MAKGGEITYTAESYYKNKLGVWEDSIAYEYSEYFADDLEDFDLVMQRIRDRGGIDYDDSWVSWFENLYSEFGRANVIEYIGANELSERLKRWKDYGYL